MLANLPGLNLESDFLRPAIPTPDKQPDIMTQLAADILNAGLDEYPEANIEPRRVIKTTGMSPRDDLDPGVFPKIEEEQEILSELSDRYDDDNDDNSIYEEDEVEDIPEHVIQITRSGRVTRPPNNLEPRHGPGWQAHGNSRDAGVNFPLIGKSSGSEVDCIDFQYTGAGYTTRQGVLHFIIDDGTPAPRAMSDKESEAHIVGVIFSQYFSLNKCPKIFGNRADVAVKKELSQIHAMDTY